MAVHAPALTLHRLAQEASSFRLEGALPISEPDLRHPRELLLNPSLVSEKLSDLRQAFPGQLESEECHLYHLAVFVSGEEFWLSAEAVGLSEGLLRRSQLESTLQLVQVQAALENRLQEWIASFETLLLLALGP